MTVQGAPGAGPYVFTFIGTGGRRLATAQGYAASISKTKVPPGYLRAVVEGPGGHRAWVQPIRVP